MVVKISPTHTGCKVAVGSVCATAHILSLDSYFLKVEGDNRKLQKLREMEAGLRQALARLFSKWPGSRRIERGVVLLRKRAGPHSPFPPPQSVAASLRPAQFHHYLTCKYMKKSKPWVYLLKQLPA